MLRRLAVVLVVLLVLSVFAQVILPVKAETTVSTYASLELETNLPDSNYVQVGYPVTIGMMVQPPPPAPADQFTGLNLTIVKPDGTSMFIGPITSYPNGSTYTLYTPDQVGVFTFLFQYPGQGFANGTIIYLPSMSAKTKLTVNSPNPTPTATPQPTANPTPTGPVPVISSVTPISASVTQAIRILGSGFGDTQPATLNLGEGSIDTVGGGRDKAGYAGTPVIQIHDDVRNTWQAGVQDSPDSGSCSIGVFLTSWSDSEIVLGGFGSALRTDDLGQWSIVAGDPMRVVVITPAGMATYSTVVVPSNGTQPYPTPTPQQPSPVIQLSCQSNTAGSNFQAKILGNITFNNTAAAGLSVLLSYSVNGGNSWNDLTLVNTDNNGGFVAVWTPMVTGNFLVKADWAGNSTHAGASTTVNLVVTPLQEQSVFSVTTNSTLTGFSFDSDSRQLSFAVSGPTGTTGYVEAYLPKTLITDVSSLQVYLDGQQIAYTMGSQADSWQLTFSYHHSTHNVAINLGAAPSTTLSVQIPYPWLIFWSAIAATALAAVLLVLKEKKQET